MNKQLQNVIVRAAQPEDKSAVLNFCQHTWAYTEDYIAQVWDRWMADPSGQILVAALNDRPIAITRVVQLSEREGWWEALRVDPQYRGRGLVRSLDPAIDQYFRTMGISTIRCCVASWNSAVPDLIKRRGYHPVACYLEHSAPAVAASTHPLRQLSAGDGEAAWQLLQSTQDAPSLFVCRGAKWQALTIAQLQERLQLGKVWGYWQQQLQGILIQSHLESADSALWVGAIAGTADGLPEMLQATRHLAFHLQYPKVSGFFLKTHALLTTLQQAGYSASPTDEFWVYEKYT